jgi:argininosuccinate synthase
MNTESPNLTYEAERLTMEKGDSMFTNGSYRSVNYA